MIQNKYILLSASFTLTLFFLTFYSYSQVDLNLTLSSNYIYQLFQNRLTYLGYFNRPLSSLIYIILFITLFLHYFYILLQTVKKSISVRQVIFIISLSCIILFFSYPAFSHDIFNYLFDARIVTKYYANPYTHSALDYPGDLWVRFMHWTHRTYPYGPVWLLITLPFSWLGFGKLVMTLWNFKIMIALFHIGNIILIYKILSRINSENRLLGISFYALNPLIIIESLVSPHNEVVMLFFLLMVIYYGFIKKKQLFGIFNLLLSAGIKYTTIILIPLFIIYKKNRKMEPSGLIYIILFLLIPVLLIQIYYREPYPWYFIPIIGVTSLICNKRIIMLSIIGVSFGILLRYFPYLYYGDYSKNVSLMQNLVSVIGVLITTICVIGLRKIKRI